MKILRRGTLVTVWRVTGALITALLLGAILAACGGDDEDDATPEPAVSNDNFAQSGLSRGQQAPDFTLPTSDGATVSLSDFTAQDQPVLLFFHMAGG